MNDLRTANPDQSETPPWINTRSKTASCRPALWLMTIVIMAFLGPLALPMIDNAAPSLIDDHDIIFALQGDSSLTLKSLGESLSNVPEYQELFSAGKTS